MRRGGKGVANPSGTYQRLASDERQQELFIPPREHGQPYVDKNGDWRERA
ncbi:hypothetical protein [Xenorhabdus santafensis]|nr:hypothetical protein [Xenorhabdus sp. 12]